MSLFLTKISNLFNKKNIVSITSKYSTRLLLTISRQLNINQHQHTSFSTINYEINNRLAYITLNRPKVFNAINDLMPKELSECVEKANNDPSVHVIVLSGAGKAFCSGYDLSYYAQNKNENSVQEMPWDPMKDYTYMKRNTEYFMSLFRSPKPTLCKINGDALAGGSDIALCCDIIIMANEAHIGYMPARVWGCPTTAMWIYR
jgi:enoyl-CoA hydratase